MKRVRSAGDAARDEIDFIMMYATHDAFRRDLDRFAAGGIGAVRAGWDTFKTQLLLHHSAEDDHLWPVVREAARTRPGSLAVLDQMEAEHARLDPLLSSVEQAATDRSPGLPDAVHRLSAALIGHLDHEERDGLPLVQAVLTPADWKAFARHIARRQGVRGAATYVPWVLEDCPEPKGRRFLAALPPPVRVINRFLWQPRYRRRHIRLRRRVV